MFELIISVIAPHRCVICQREGSLVCGWCLPEAVPPLPSRCYHCYRATDNSLVCPNCRHSNQLKHVWVASEYGGISRRLVHLLKFERAKAAVAAIALIMQQALPYLERDTIITYVPAATSRVRARGYDQARLIAKQLSRRLDLPVVTMLARQGQKRQVGANRLERLRQLDGSFSPRRQGLIKGAHILLVDDVVTTGATLEQAARVLKTAGAAQVDAAVFAQTLPT